MSKNDDEGLRVGDVTSENDLIAVSLLNEFIADRVVIAGMANSVSHKDFDVTIELDPDEKAMAKVLLTHKSGDKFLVWPRLVTVYVHGAEAIHAKAIEQNPLFALLILPVFMPLHERMMDMAGRAALAYCLANRL